MRKFIVGVMGAGEDAEEGAKEMAFRLGGLIAREGWVVLSGGRQAGVMEEVNRGAKQIAGSLTVGILPTAQAAVSDYVDVVITTDMGNARNNLNVLSSDVVVACGTGGAGTVSEIALAIKAKKPVILLGTDRDSKAFFQRIGKAAVHTADHPEGVIARIKTIKG
jgi:uncharacterized protein (TIGR00725 family)